MTVARILAAKGRDVVRTEPHRTLAEAVAILMARNIGAIVVGTACMATSLEFYGSATSFMRSPKMARPRLTMPCQNIWRRQS